MPLFVGIDCKYVVESPNDLSNLGFTSLCGHSLQNCANSYTYCISRTSGLNDQKKSLVKEFLDAFILKANLQQQLS
ncbi:hypothetical protein SAMN05443669_100694 [Flavobacterium xanthum]|uniref:Uncharacterized protein n=1 Tax=Flavobacterium xanthum TaxID=69322 RepID=A0A1M7A6U8_9FLAO|nr:hypothetical protein SAMN05443669_100694 [Flavobacterium xanthum]